MSNDNKPIILIAEDDPNITELWMVHIEIEDLEKFHFIFSETIAETVLKFMLNRDSIVLIALDGILKERVCKTLELPAIFRLAGYEGPIVAISGQYREEQIEKGCDSRLICPSKDQLISLIVEWAKNP